MASRGVNKVILVGNLGGDPESRTFPNGDAVTNITVATSESWKDKNTGEPKERTEWHRVVFHRRLAEIASEYLQKGSKVYIEGGLQTRKWQDKTTGADRYTTEIVAREMQMIGFSLSLDSRGDNAGGQAPQQAQQQAPQQQYKPQQQPMQRQPQQMQQAPTLAQQAAQHPQAQPMQQHSGQAPANFDDPFPF